MVTAAIANWVAVSGMYLRLTLEENGVSLRRYPVCAESAWMLPEAFIGESVTVKLEAQDAARQWHTLAESSFTGSGAEDSRVPLTADTDILTGYTLVTAPSSAVVYLSVGGRRQTLSSYGGRYWLADTANLAVSYYSFAADADYENYDCANPAVTVSAGSISVAFAAFPPSASTARLPPCRHRAPHTARW